MAGASFRIEGLDRLQAAMKQFPLASRRGALRGMRRGVLRVQGRARQLSPVDTGRLRASIAVIVRVLVRAVRGIIGSAVEYAQFQEDRVGYLDGAVRIEGPNVANDIFGEVTRELERLA